MRKVRKRNNEVETELPIGQPHNIDPSTGVIHQPMFGIHYEPHSALTVMRLLLIAARS